MNKRVTISIDDEVLKKLRKIQANAIKNSESSVSFSTVINHQLQKVLK